MTHNISALQTLKPLEATYLMRLAQHIYRKIAGMETFASRNHFCRAIVEQSQAPRDKWGKKPFGTTILGWIYSWASLKSVTQETSETGLKDIAMPCRVNFEGRIFQCLCCWLMLKIVHVSSSQRLKFL